MKHINKAIPPALGLALLAPAARAQNFTYTTGDLVAAFRQAGASSDLEVDLGPVTTYENASAPISISQFTSSQLSSAFGSLNGVSFSVFGTQGPSGGVGTDSAYTSYLTLARTSPGTPTTPPNGYNNPTSHSIASAINGIEGVGASSGALVYSPNATYPPSSQTAILIPTSGASSANSFTTKFTATAGLQSLVASPGIENTTPANFTTTPGATAVSDLYLYAPGTSGHPATLEGDFVFDNSGDLTFNPVSVPEPGTITLAAIGGIALLGVVRSRARKI
jgi:hypothetical protein